MFKKKKQLSPEDVTGEDIRKHIDRHKLFNKHIETHIVSKSITFIMLFFMWLFFTITVKSIQIRYMLLIVGFPLLLMLFHIYIIHYKEDFHYKDK